MGLDFVLPLSDCPLNLSEYVSSLHAQSAAAAAAVSPCASASGSPAVLPHLSDSLLKNLTLQLSRALYHIHSRGLVHLDIKPDNILISFGGIVRLADFGQARMIGVAPGSPLATGAGAAATSAALSMCPEFDMDGIEGDSVYMVSTQRAHSDSNRRCTVPACYLAHARTSFSCYRCVGSRVAQRRQRSQRWWPLLGL